MYFERRSRKGDVLRSYTVVIDGHKVGRLRLGQSELFSVDPGRHSVQVKIDRFASPAVEVEVHEGSTLEMVCAGPSVLLNFRELRRYRKGGRDTYLTLRTTEVE